MRIRLGRKSRWGMSLVEIVMATGIIAITGDGVISSINYGLCIMRIARENQRATQVMLEKLEAIRLYNWSQVTNADFIPDTFTAPYDPTSPTSSRWTTYYGTMSITAAHFVGPTRCYARTLT